MINNDRIVPVKATDLVSLYSAMLFSDLSGSLTKLAASDPGEFTVTSASTALIAAEPVKTLDIDATASSVTAATIYFLAALDYKGFSIDGTAETPAAGSVDVVPGSGDLYKAVLATGDITITKVGV